MPACTRNGCRKEYSESSTENCHHHSGVPVFHEGLKSWSCCKEKNKPVLDFDDFVAIPGCTQAEKHTDVKPTTANANQSHSTKIDNGAVPLKLSQASDGSEVYGTAVQKKMDLPTAVAQARASATGSFIIEEDDLSVPIGKGTKCLRKGCDYVFVSEEISRIGDGEGAECHFHPAPPLFREGSKGYLCCKRRVLEFDEFLKIPGCTKGRHLFAPKVAPGELSVTCRLDHYQTPKDVHVSVFAKQSDKEKSSVIIGENYLKLDVYMPGGKRFQKVIELYGPVNVNESSYQILNTKIEIKLTKLDGRSWNMLERSASPSGTLNLTFGVGGRHGTVGAKEMVLGVENQLGTP